MPALLMSSVTPGAAGNRLYRFITLQEIGACTTEVRKMIISGERLNRV